MKMVGSGGFLAKCFLIPISVFLSFTPSYLYRILAKILGLFFYVLKVRLDTVSSNVDRASKAYPQLFGREKSATTGSVSKNREWFIKKTYVELGHLVLELILFLGPFFRRYLKKNVEVEGHSLVEQALKDGKKIILLSSHVGNWEIMAASASIFTQFRVCIVTKHLKPEWFHQWVEEARKRLGVSAAYEPRTMKQILQAFKKGDAVGFVMDQYMGDPIAVKVPVFGIEVGTSRVPAALAVRMDAEVFPVICYRTDKGKYKIRIDEAIDWRSVRVDTSEEGRIKEITAIFAAKLERFIMEQPLQWLWIHRRFK